MKHKVAELEGGWLDAAVAKAEGSAVSPGYAKWQGYSPSSNWSQGGTIIERERIQISLEAVCDSESDPDLGFAVWEACPFGVLATLRGPTPLIAAMRAYVASRFGDEIEL